MLLNLYMVYAFTVFGSIHLCMICDFYSGFEQSFSILFSFISIFLFTESLEHYLAAIYMYSTLFF